ncbi:cation:proton antiporter [Alteromonas sp. ASW11-36]|uniref:Cation:proton antiporter n=1 Tax=Alteromonas arenosi TaxID=3055817 RepID=A0ABT7SVI4_9ALTE|nr:monovalent cation:proton antiporter family protein [Alteromonas sp. ASW11-36]MDM7860197.1 cation:proton antiporter [Alteromonas sp. ASW11-36]
MHNEFVQVIVLMVIAVGLIWLLKRMGLPPILSYIVTGIIAGPDVMALFEQPEQMHLLAEVGIVFLLFSLGLEFSLPKLVAMRHMVFGVGAGQVILTTLVFWGGALLIGLPGNAALVIGGMIALSSTAIVIKQVAEMGILHNQRTQLAISVLLFQDLAVVPFLIAIPLMSPLTEGSFAVAISLALLKGVTVVTILLAAGKWGLPLLFREVASTRTDELFVLTTIVVALLAAGLTYWFGLSMALGAFLAGMMLSESQYRYQLEADIRPFRDMLMGLFFVTVGMQLNLNYLQESWYWVIIATVAVLALKVVLMQLVSWLFKVASRDSWAAAFKLCQIGEFSFVLAALAVTHQVLTTQVASFIISVGILSMALTPYLIEHSMRFARLLSSRNLVSSLNDSGSLSKTVEALKNHVVVVGFGRVGQSSARMLKLEGIEFVAIDSDPIRVQESRAAGENIIFGDATHKDILRSANLNAARLVLITFDQPDKVSKLISVAKELQPEIKVIVRIRKDNQLNSLYEAGATQVVPELQEGSLMLISQLLHYSGVPMSRILKRVRAERKGRYDHMHGFYPGETTEINPNTQDKLEFMHPVIVTANAFATGKSLNQLNLSKLRVVLKGLRRNHHEIDNPQGDEVIHTGDVLIVAGKPRRVERAERFILEGD